MNEFFEYHDEEDPSVAALQQQLDALAAMPDETAGIGVDADLTAEETEVSAESAPPRGNPWLEPPDYAAIAGYAAADIEVEIAGIGLEPAAPDDAEHDAVEYEAAEAPVSTGVFTIPEEATGTAEPQEPAPAPPSPKPLTPTPREVALKAHLAEVVSPPQHLEDFTGDSAPRLAQKFDAIYDGAVAEHRLYTDRTNDNNGDTIKLQKVTPTHSWRVELRTQDNGNRDILVVQKDLTSGEAVRHDYRADRRGVWCREGGSVLHASVLPVPGELPEADRKQLIADIYTADKPNEDLAREMGILRWRSVGNDELGFIGELVGEAKPQRVTVGNLHNLVVARSHSLHLPSEEAARHANADFTGNTTEYLKTRGYDPLEGGEVAITRNLHERGAHGEVTVGTGRNTDGLTVPYMHISVEAPVGGSRFTSLLEKTGYGYHLSDLKQGIWESKYLYRERNGLLMSESRFYLADTDGRVIGICGGSRRMPSDELEARLLRNFMWNPHL